MPIVSRSRSRIEIPTSIQRSRNRAVVISRLLFACFFNVNLGYEIISPELQNFRQNLIDGKHLEILKPFIEEYIAYYNTKRLQRNLGILTPLEKHEQYLSAA